MTLRAYSLAELGEQNLPLADWLVEGLLPTGALVLLAGQPKAGKSLVCLDLVACVAQGEPFLGRETAQGMVLIAPAEDQLTVVRNRLLTRLNNDLTAPIGVVPADGSLDQRLHLDDPNSFKELEALIDQHKPSLVILDPLRELHGCAENEADEMAALLRPLRQLAHQKSTTILLVHHANKHGTETRAVRGSSAIVGSVDQVLLAERMGDETDATSEQVIVITAEGRYGPRQRVAARLGEGLRWRPLEGQDRQRNLPAAEQIVQFLAAKATALPTADVAKELGLAKHTVQNQMTSLVGEGKLDRAGAGTKTDPYRYAISSAVLEAHGANGDGHPHRKPPVPLVPDRHGDGAGGMARMIPPDAHTHTSDSGGTIFAGDLSVTEKLAPSCGRILAGERRDET